MSDSDADLTVDVETRRAVEAIVLAATEPVHPTVMAQLLEVSVEAIEELCAQLAAEYEAQGRGFQLARVAGGYRFQTHPDAYAYVERFVLDGQTARLSGPALETLAIIAYKQPVSRAQLSAIRGVNVDATLKTLVARGYVDEIGHDPTPGNPSMFATSRLFLERLGLNSLSDLPALADFVPEASIVEALERGLLLSSVNAQLSSEDVAEDADGSEAEVSGPASAPDDGAANDGAANDIELDVTGEQ